MKKDDDPFFYYHANIPLPVKIGKLLDEAKRESGGRLPIVVLKSTKGEIVEVLRRQDLERAARRVRMNAISLWQQFLVEKFILRNRK